MKLIYFITFILTFNLASSLSREVQNFENMLRQALYEYNLLPSEISTYKTKFSVEMQDDVKEHLAEITVSSRGNNSDQLTLTIKKSVANDFTKNVMYIEEPLEDQAPLYQNLLKRIFTSPVKNINFVNLDDIVYYFTTFILVKGIKVEEEYSEGVFYIKYKSQEANVLLISISRQDELRDDMLYDMNFVITFTQALKGYPEYKIHKLNAFPNVQSDISIDFISRLETNGYVNNNYQILNSIIGLLPNDYQTEFINLDRIQYDFRLGANSKFFKLKTYNGSFVFCSTYFEDVDKFGKFELRIFRVDNYHDQNFKLQQRDNLKTLQFYRMQYNSFRELMESLKFDELLNTLGYEIAQMYIKEIQNTQYHNLYQSEEYDNEMQSTFIQPARILPRLTLRNVKTSNSNDQLLYSFEYSCMSGLVTVEIINHTINDNYKLDFNVIHYSKEMVRKYIETTLTINKRIQEA